MADTIERLKINEAKSSILEWQRESIRRAPTSSLHSLRSLFVDEDLKKLMDLAIQKNLEDLYAVNILDATAVDALTAMIDPTLNFVNDFYYKGFDLKIDSTVKSNRSRNLSFPIYSGSSVPSKQLQPECTLENVVEMEETLWSPILGVKGQIDIVCDYKNWNINNINGAIFARSLIPIELKTGSWKASTITGHTAQVGLQISPIYLN